MTSVPGPVRAQWDNGPLSESKRYRADPSIVNAGRNTGKWGLAEAIWSCWLGEMDEARRPRGVAAVGSRGVGRSGRAGWGRVAAWPQQGLGDDRGSFVDGQRGRAVQLVPKFQGLADAIAERGVVRPGKHAITGKPVGRHVGESRRGRADPAVSRR